jgi:hypothetical protein
MAFGPQWSCGALRPAFRAEALAKVARVALPLLLLIVGGILLRDRGTAAADPASAGGALVAPVDAEALCGAGLVLAGALASLPFAVRRFVAAGRGRGSIDVVETRPLGGRRSLLVVEVDGRRLLLGASEQGLALLTELSRTGRPFSGALAGELAAGMRAGDAA